MPVQVVWDNPEKTILRQIYSGHVKIEDFFAATDEVFRMAQEVDHIVHSINDRTPALSFPARILPALRYANKHVPPNLGLRILIKPSLFARLMVDMGKVVAPKLTQDVYYVETLAEAYALIHKQRTIPPQV
jgi:hypothetical protein